MKMNVNSNKKAKFERKAKKKVAVIAVNNNCLSVPCKHDKSLSQVYSPTIKRTVLFNRYRS